MEVDRRLTSLEKAETLARFADDMKAERIERIDIRSKTPIADYFVICTGNSDTHLNAIADKVAENMRAQGVRPIRRTSGPNAGGWILFDFGDVVFHVMLEEKRQFYDLETFWSSMQADPNLLD